MGYNVYNLKSGGGGSYGRKSGVDEFEDAAMMAKEGAKMVKEGVEMMCEISEEMSEQFGFRERRGGGGQSGNRGGGYGGRERGGYGGRERGGYGERDDWDEMDEYGERRMRDSRGRFR